LLETLKGIIDKREDILIFYPPSLNCHGAVRDAGRKIYCKLDASLLTAGSRRFREILAITEHNPRKLSGKSHF
jgi:hypothetical protein